MGQVLTRDDLREKRALLKKQGRRVVFTNGCFDILHRGHVEYLTGAKALGDILVVGINTDRSVREIKGAGRPVVGEQDRAFLVANLIPVDFVTLFDEPTPRELITALVPDVLVKGADWDIDRIVGRDIVEAAGGSVETIALTPGHSTSAIIRKILHQT